MVFHKEVIGSVLLMLASVSAVIIANSVYYEAYENWLHLDISFSFANYSVSNSLLHWINESAKKVWVKA